jgi:GNAT superfamily N-acetyltransferase
MVATICYYSPQRTRGYPWYDREDVASFGQLAVEPTMRTSGIGSRLMELVEQMALRDGAAEIALDTAESAEDLIRFYGKRGYRFIDHVQWKMTNYRSVIMSKRLGGPALPPER